MTPTSNHNSNEDNGNTQVALFIDFENVAISAEETFGRLKTDVLIQSSEKLGRCTTRRAYGDWTRFSKYSQDLLEYSIEAIQLFHYGGFKDKNAADIQMVADILETLFTHPDIDIFVLATGDSDFSAVARKLRSYGKRVIGIGLQRATSEVLVKACDEFLIYDTIVEPETRTQSYGLEQARQLLLNTLLEMTRTTNYTHILAAALKPMMLKKDPTFSEVKLGYSQFKDFLAEQKDLIELGRKDNQMVVSPLPNMTEKASQDPNLEYRRALDREGLLLLDPYTRTDVLRDLFVLLHDAPQRYTLDGAEAQLKAHYNSTNVLRSRDEVHETLKLLKFVDVVETVPQSWELDPLALKPDLEQQEFVDRCESVYLDTLMTRNLPIDNDLVSKLLFGTADKRARVKHLVEQVRSREQKRGAETRKVQAWQLPARIASKESLQEVLAELENFSLNGEQLTLEAATQASEEGMRIRSSDFEQAQNHFLKAAKIIYRLLQAGSPGVSLVDLEWQLSSYCAAAAGAAYFSHDYAIATKYYLAFFSIASETEPVWEKVDRLAQPMLSFYFTLAANQAGENLDVSPGHKNPALVVALILCHPNAQVRQYGEELAAKLARINPALLRNVLQRLDAIIETADGDRLVETRARQALSAILQPAT